MRSSRLKVAMLAMVASIAIAGCDRGSSSSPPIVTPPPIPPPPVNFTTFVIDQFGATADDTDPVAVDDIDFAFRDQDNPDAFSTLLTDP